MRQMKYVMLKDVCTIKMGQSPDSDSYNDNGEGVPFFQGNADFGERYPVTRKWCSTPTKMAVPDDILISVRAPIGAMNYAKEECCIGRGLAALTPDKTKVSPEFIFWLLKGKNAELNSKGTGSTFKAIGRKVLEETKVPDIPLEKQLEYSGTLEKVYAVIQHRKSELQMLDNLIKARFVEMFANWKKKYLAEPLGEYLQDITYGFTNPMPDAEEGPWKITAKDVVNGIVNLDTARKTLQESYDKLTEKSKPQLGDVLLTKDGTLGRTAVVEIGGMCVNQSVAVLRINEKILPKYLSILLQMPKYQRDMIADAGGGTIKHIYITKVVKMPIVVPSIEEQNTFLDFVNQVDKSKFKEKLCYIKYKILKIRHHQIYLLRK